MSRATAARISLTALRHNLKRARALAPQSRIMAMVKANAYGHGIAAVAPALAEADAFGVASLEEALAIRRAGLAHPIVLLEGVFDAAEIASAAHNGCELVVHDEHQLRLVEAAPREAGLRVWLKVDSGMHRLGFAPGDVAEAWRRLNAAPAVRKPLRLMTHLACADEPENPTTRAQLKVFADVTAGMQAERSIANSAALLASPETHADWVRPGILLYGASPFAGRCGADEGLLPAMTVSTELIAVKDVARGAAVGYGHTWIAPADIRIGIAAIGYGDGYPRHAANGTPVLVNGTRCALAGRVAMDMIAIDLGRDSRAEVGDPVVLWGQGLPVEEVARAAGTICYELLCGVTQRVKFKIEETDLAGMAIPATMR